MVHALFSYCCVSICYTCSGLKQPPFIRSWFCMWDIHMGLPGFCASGPTSCQPSWLPIWEEAAWNAFKLLVEFSSLWLEAWDLISTGDHSLLLEATSGLYLWPSAKWLRGVAATASILSGPATGTLTWHSCKHMSSITAHRVTATHSPDMTVSLTFPAFPSAPLTQMRPPGSLPSPQLFWFELINLALPWESQSTPPMDPMKGMYPRFCLPLHLNSTSISLCGPLGWEVGRVLLPGPMSNTLLYLVFF